MKMTPVTSSLLKAVHYDPNVRELTVEFKDLSRYRYSAVAQATFDAMMSADSCGSYFARNIKKQFEGRKVG